MIRQFTDHAQVDLRVDAAAIARSSRRTHARWLWFCVLCALASCAKHTGSKENASEPDEVEKAVTRDPDSKREESADAHADDDDLGIADGGKAGASGAAPAAMVGGRAPGTGGADAAGGPAAMGGSGALASAAAGGGGGVTHPATSVAGTLALPGAGAAGAPVLLGPPGSNTAWLGGGQPVACDRDDHCVKSLYTPICNLTKGVCDVCPDMAQENALAARVNACILAASPRCLNDEDCRFGNCITSCDGSR